MSAVQFVPFDKVVGLDPLHTGYLCCDDNGCRTDAVVAVFRVGVEWTWANWTGHACCENERHVAEVVADVLACTEAAA